MPVSQGPFRRARLKLRCRNVSGFGIGQADTIADPVDMRIDRDNVFAKGETHYDIGAFPADSRQS